ncbi:MAG TPA: hypothetical protein VGU25_11110 [Acidobacteriaceae bacterium]|nr:hypothetical protein [Acidobacteriaceae bacterium]
MKTQRTKSGLQRSSARSKTAVRGKYFNKLEGSNLAIIDPELHEHFPDSESVNRALRAFLGIREQMKAASPSRSGSKRQPEAA